MLQFTVKHAWLDKESMLKTKQTFFLYSFKTVAAVRLD
jgi:hypothetical protein